MTPNMHKSASTQLTIAIERRPLDAIQMAITAKRIDGRISMSVQSPDAKNNRFYRVSLTHKDDKGQPCQRNRPDLISRLSFVRMMVWPRPVFSRRGVSGILLSILRE